MGDPVRECHSWKKEVPKTTRRSDGTVPKGRHGFGTFMGLGEGGLANYRWREIPSFCIFDWSVVRFIPSLAAAPTGPPMIHSDSRRALRICSRSACSSVVVPEFVT